MRLYLSSFDIGDRPDELVKLAPGGRVGLIMNALDNMPEVRESWQLSQAEKLARLGFSVAAFDLRDYFGDAASLERDLSRYDMVWINGGNAFLLRRAMHLSGFDAAIKTALAGDRIVYAGFSAAAVVLPQSLRGLELVDDPDDVPPGYPRGVIWDGLGVLPYSIVVHADSTHPESTGTTHERDYYEARGIPYRAIRDGQALVVANGQEFLTPG